MDDLRAGTQRPISRLAGYLPRGPEIFSAAFGQSMQAA